MAVVCPSILAADKKAYRGQIEKVASFAHRIQIDLTDGVFASHKTITPDEAWWPVGFKADIHLMYKHPAAAVRKILQHRPNLIIIHAEAEGDFSRIVEQCRRYSVKLGIALLPATAAETIFPALPSINHVLIFSGDLGSFGGHADLKLLNKSSTLKKQKPELEIGWDGGINDQNVSELIFGGVDVLNVGGFIQQAADPARAYDYLERIAEETGTT